MGWPRMGKLGKNISGGSGLKGDDQVLMGGRCDLGWNYDDISATMKWNILEDKVSRNNTKGKMLNWWWRK